MEKIAIQLISASEKYALCDEHYEEMKMKKNDKNPKHEKCLECHSAKYQFEECTMHREELQVGLECEKCKDFKRLVKDFQTHKHTFSCQKKNKVINIKKAMDGKMVTCKDQQY